MVTLKISNGLLNQKTGKFLPSFYEELHCLGDLGSTKYLFPGLKIWMDEWMVGWMDAWMHGCMDRLINNSTLQQCDILR